MEIYTKHVDEFTRTVQIITHKAIHSSHNIFNHTAYPLCRPTRCTTRLIKCFNNVSPFIPLVLLFPRDKGFFNYKFICCKYCKKNVLLEYCFIAYVPIILR